MSERINAIFDQIEAQRLDEEIAVSDDALPLEFLTAIYRDQRQPIARRLRAAIEAAPYYHPKLAVHASINAEEFSVRLERAIGRSTKPLRAPLALPAPSKSDD